MAHQVLGGSESFVAHGALVPVVAVRGRVLAKRGRTLPNISGTGLGQGW